MTLKHLDLFCGYGGWTDGFMAHGFQSTGIDNNPKVERKYKGNFILADLEDYEPSGEWDVITASPPCTEFSIAKKYGWGTQNEMKGLGLVYRAFHLIEKLKPTYWILENVRGIEGFLGPPADSIRYNHHFHGKRALLYGKFPQIGLVEDINHVRDKSLGTVRDPNLRGLIPFPLSSEIAKTIKQDMIII